MVLARRTPTGGGAEGRGGIAGRVELFTKSGVGDPRLGGNGLPVRLPGLLVRWFDPGSDEFR